MLKKKGLIKTPAQLKKEEDERIKREVFLKSQGI